MMRSLISLRRATVAPLAASAALFSAPAMGQEPTPAQEPMLLTESVVMEEAGLNYPPAIGGTETINERYPTGEVHIERQVRLDEEHNYVNHGPWKMFDRKGNVIAHGNYDQGKRTGVWTRWHGKTAATSAYPFNRFKAPFVSTASFEDGVMEGVWMILDSEEKKVRQITIEDGKRHGATVTWLPNGEVLRQSAYENGKPVGEVVQLKKSGAEPQRLATYLDGRKVVTKTTNHPRSRQKKSVELYLDKQTVQTKLDSFWDLTFAEFSETGEAMLHGVSQSWHPNGQLASEGEYRYGKKVGRFTYWHANGQKRAEGVFREDLHEGLWVWWHENGLKSALGSYESGAESGQWYWWKGDGQLDRKQAFDGSQPRTAKQPASSTNR